jgi:hypothetical protein
MSGSGVRVVAANLVGNGMPERRVCVAGAP